MKRIIEADKSIIVAADVPYFDIRRIACAVKGIDGIGGIKLGIMQIGHGLSSAVRTIREIMGQETVIIYDHQKAGNDIPDMGVPFAETLRFAGIDAAILFPFAGPATQEKWTKALLDRGISVITGGVMTHEKFLVSEGGRIADGAVMETYGQAVDLGLTDFVVPGTKLNWVMAVKKFMDDNLGEGNYTLWAPGFVKQGGVISECGKAAGSRFQAIVGSAIYNAGNCEEMRVAAVEMTRQIAA